MIAAHDVLIIGYSSLVRRRVIPALLRIPAIGRIHVASRTAGDLAEIPAQRRGGRWDDYSTALEQCDRGLAYISLPNHLHAQWARAALEAGFHVIVDKPAVIGDPSVAIALSELARSRSLVIAEATVWPYHPMAEELKRAFVEHSGGIRTAIATFASPPMNPDDFRYRSHCGGGAVLDRGSYAASCGRELFGEDPLRVECVVQSRAEHDPEVDLSFSVMMEYPQGVLLGHFSIESEYVNRLEVVAAEFSCRVDRVFTPPADYEATLEWSEGNEHRRQQVPQADTFAEFIGGVLSAIDSEDYVTLSEMLVRDAVVLDRIWRASRRDGR